MRICHLYLCNLLVFPPCSFVEYNCSTDVSIPFSVQRLFVAIHINGHHCCLNLTNSYHMFNHTLSEDCSICYPCKIGNKKITPLVATFLEL